MKHYKYDATEIGVEGFGKLSAYLTSQTTEIRRLQNEIFELKDKVVKYKNTIRDLDELKEMVANISSALMMVDGTSTTLYTFDKQLETLESKKICTDEQWSTGNPTHSRPVIIECVNNMGRKYYAVYRYINGYWCDQEGEASYDCPTVVRWKDI